MSQSTNGKEMGRLARQALQEADGNRDEAVKILVKLMKNDAAILSEVIEALLHEEAWRLIRNQAETARISKGQTGAGTTKPTESTIKGLELKAERACMDLLMQYCDKRLGQANRGDLSHEQLKLRDDADRYHSVARWLQIISSKLKNDQQQVSEVWTEQELMATRLRIFAK